MSHNASGGRSRPIVLSFSGIDGAGKSTQIQILLTRLRSADLRVRLLAFWDDVAVLTRFRGFASHVVFGGDQGVGAPGQPVNRRDKNVQSIFMSPLRALLYVLDAVSLHRTIARARASKADVIIVDRYLYDELANLSLHRAAVRTYARYLLRLFPSPDLAFLIDADPVQARERKPEYPLEFLQANRASYLRLAKMAGMTVIPPGPVIEVADSITEKLASLFASAVPSHASLSPHPL